MAYGNRRSSSYGRRSFRRPSRGRLRTPGQKRWEATDFFVSSVVTWPSLGGDTSLLMMHLASIQMSWQGAAGTPEPVGVAMGATIRKLQVGGVVFDYGVDFNNSDVENQVVPSLAYALFETGLCTDKLSASVSGINPNAIQSWNPFASQFPTSELGATTPGPVTQESIRPVRIHHRKKESVQFATKRITVSEDLQVVPRQFVDTRRGTVNKRLKLVLDDDHGLFFYFATLNSGGFDAAETGPVSVWFGGTLFWRFSS